MMMEYDGKNNPLTQSKMGDWYYGDVPALFITFYALIIFLGVIGNVMVIIVMLNSKDMRNSTNIFLLNLAFADLIMLLITAPLILMEIIYRLKTVMTGKETCLASKFLRRTMVNASVFTILALSFERYYAICKPLKANYICTNKRAVVICALVWFFAALSASPNLAVFAFKRNTRNYSAKNTFCVPNYGSFWIDVGFVVNTNVFYFIPLIILVIVYGLIIKNLIVNSVKFDSNTVIADNYANAMRYRKQVVVMLVAVVLSFFICFLPLEVLVFSKIFMPKQLTTLFGEIGIRKFEYVVNIIRLVHSTVNPIFYNLISTNFRREFVKLLKLNKLMSCSIKSKENIQNQDTFETRV